ncbi:toxin VasX [Halomonas salipaludis]|uniref:Toxin VasX N-terminal region domain-containing protein n=1 Tax=Halomonas salipaludis TaxID=2032625 RepID=A0A2A2EYV0_9GAMM|nr:toxin VasX [Halomonas salipaludis]PAU77483.1 hypothetical protein CK498_09660 [Halomonas salipaludis]
MADTDVQSTARDGAFDETSFGSGVCPLLMDVTLFPVRYAIDEAPRQADEPAPHPLSERWQGPDYPRLTTRGYTLRQLRDGWLYVYVEEGDEQRIDEYAIDGATFNGEPHLTYSTGAHLELAYSPVQWTERIHERMLADAEARQRLMRPLDLMAALGATLATGNDPLPAHVGPLTELDEHVADITPNGAVDDFTSTTVATVEWDSDVTDVGGDDEESVYEVLAHKPEISQDSVLAKVKKHDEAVFVALDDDLGIVNDLTLNLSSCVTEWEAFDDDKGHKLRIAEAVERLCGVDEALLPEGMDTDTRREALRVLYERHDAERTRGLEEVGNIYATGLPGYDPDQFQTRADAIAEELSALGINDIDQDAIEAWNAKERWRADVRFDEAIDYVREHAPELERLLERVAMARSDLIVWLERLPPSALAQGFDVCEEEQLRALLELVGMVNLPLCSTEEGQAWFNEALRNSDSLLGLTLSGFDPGVDRALVGIAHSFIETGTSDSSHAMVEPGDVIPALDLAAAVQGVLSLDSVQDSRLLQGVKTEAGESASKVIEVLKDIVSDSAKALWESLTVQALPSLNGRGHNGETVSYAMKYVVINGATHQELRGKNLTQNGEYDTQLATWQREMTALEQRIESVRRRISFGQANPGEVHLLDGLQREREALVLAQPRRFAGDGHPHLASAGMMWLKDHQRLMADRVGAGAQQARRWYQQSPGALALLIAGLNVANVSNTLEKIRRDGAGTDEWIELGSQLGYASSALMALWVMPFWNRATARLTGNRQARTIASAGVRAWEHQGRFSASRLAARLASRVAGLTTLGVVGAGLEALQVYHRYGQSNSREERIALAGKGMSTGVITLTTGAQLIGAVRGRIATASFAWVMGPWAVWTIAIASAAYLLSSWIADYFHRDSFRQWLHESSWGTASRWTDGDDEQRAEEWRELMELLLRPTLRLTPAALGNPVGAGASPLLNSRLLGSFTNRERGYWIQLALPASISGERVRISMEAARGTWVPASSFAEQPSEISLHESAAYSEDDALRVWQAWLPSSEHSSGQSFELKVSYIDTSLAPPGETRSLFIFEKEDPGRGKRIIDAKVARESWGSGLTFTVPLSSSQV